MIVLSRERQYAWPVPDSHSRRPPLPGQPGSFGEDRGDRRHCGVDLYAPQGSEVVAVANGVAQAVEIFTSPEKLAYWNRTFVVTVRMFDGRTARYAEMAATRVRVGQLVRPGDALGTVGTVLRQKDIDAAAPEYIRQLKQNRHLSMLHFELWRDPPDIPVGYIGGNLPKTADFDLLLDPTPLLVSAAQNG